MNSTVINIKTDIKVKQEAQKIASDLGLTLSGAINGFLKSAANLADFKKNPTLSLEQKNFLNQAICKFVVLYITSSVVPFGFVKLKHAKARLNETGLSKLDLTSVDLEYRILGHLYNFSVVLLIIYQFVLFRLRHICKISRFQLKKILRTIPKDC